MFLLITTILLGAPFLAFADVGSLGLDTVAQFQSYGTSPGGFLTFLGTWLFPMMIASAILIATLSIIFAGFQWMAGSISPPAIEKAKDRIGASLLGLAIVLTSWILLNTINPEFVRLQAPSRFSSICPVAGCPSVFELLVPREATPITPPPEVIPDAPFSERQVEANRQFCQSLEGHRFVCTHYHSSRTEEPRDPFRWDHPAYCTHAEGGDALNNRTVTECIPI